MWSLLPQENCSQYPELTAWTRRMRVARAQGAISEERLQVHTLPMIAMPDRGAYDGRCH